VPAKEKDYSYPVVEGVQDNSEDKEHE